MKFSMIKNVAISFISIFYLSCGIANSAVLFSDNFESESSSWTCGGGELSKWSDGYGACASTSGFGYEWKIGPGRNGGNAVYSWKKAGVPNGYRSESQRWLSGGQLSQEVYHRWYMKVPVAAQYDKVIDQGFKLWRYILRENGFSGSPEVYLNVSGDTFASGNLVTYDTGNGYKTLVPINSFNDGNWHCHELRLRLNDNGASNGIIEYWLDGVKKVSYSNLQFDTVTNLKVHRIGVGVGNVSDNNWYQSAWSAIAFDDIVLSTAYNGPDGSGGGDATAPTVSITTSNPSSISSDSLAVSGTASDNTGVSSCKWRIGVAPDANNGTACTGTTSFTCSTSGYSSGSSNLYVGCGDAAGNWGSDSIAINFTPPGGVTPPPGVGEITPGNLLFSESFENSSFSSRGWYDGGSTSIVSGGKSGNCLKWTWVQGGSTPTGMTTMRRQFAAQNKVLVRANFKLGSEWRGHQQTYGGPHIMHVMGSVDGVWDGLSYADLNTYIEFFSNLGSPYSTYTRFAIQDSERIVTSPTPPNNLVGSTQARAVAGCNGNQGDSGSLVSCYQDGGNWFNGRYWDNTVNAIPKNAWVQVDTYMEMNTISNNVANADGKLRQWVNGTLVKSSDTIVFRTGAQPSKLFDKLILAPFMGASPIAQTMYVDELAVYDGYSESGQSVTAPAPAGLNINVK